MSMFFCLLHILSVAVPLFSSSQQWTRPEDTKFTCQFNIQHDGCSLQQATGSRATFNSMVERVQKTVVSGLFI